MLELTRELNQSIMIGDNIELKVTRISNNLIRLAIETNK